MNKLIFVIGATAAGKTYFIDQNYKGKDLDVLNVYDYQQRVYDEEGFGEHIPFDAMFKCLMKANNMLLDDIIEKLSQGRDVVVEQTFYKAKRRIAYIDKIRKSVDVLIEMYVMNPGDSFWQSNIEKRNLKEDFGFYKKNADEIEFPNPAEGIDAIYEVTDGEVVLRMDPPRPEILDEAREELRQEAERIHREDEAKKRRREFMESMKERPFWHYCEVCGKKEFITAKDAFNGGWDYPPSHGAFGLLGPRTCGDCLIKDTLFWKINTSGKLPLVVEKELSPEELVTWRRIKGEPESLLADEEEEK
ncbi:MAG: ATP-binding protein [Lachnospiraceae bacterium]|nr:ATP-binding protein [Lachnospiraceae bacterium]